MTGDRLVLLDVGHGNAAVLHAQGHVCVIDAGPGTTLLEYIRTSNISSIDLAILSHADKDHIAGLLGLLTAGNVAIKRVLLNTDSEKASSTWADLAHELELHWKNQGLTFEVALTAQQSPIAIGTTTLEILAPTPALAMMGPGSKTHNGRRITSNTISAVIRIVYDGQPVSLLTGDLDAVGLDELLGRGVTVTAPLLVFPHHGGGSGTRSADFATRLVTAATPTSVSSRLAEGATEIRNERSSMRCGKWGQRHESYARSWPSSARQSFPRAGQRTSRRSSRMGGKGTAAAEEPSFYGSGRAAASFLAKLLMWSSLS